MTSQHMIICDSILGSRRSGVTSAKTGQGTSCQVIYDSLATKLKSGRYMVNGDSVIELSIEMISLADGDC